MLFIISIMQISSKSSNIRSLLRNITRERERILNKNCVCNKTQMNVLGTYVSMFYLVDSHSERVHVELCYIPPWLWADVTHPASITISEVWHSWEERDHWPALQADSTWSHIHQPPWDHGGQQRGFSFLGGGGGTGAVLIVWYRTAAQSAWWRGEVPVMSSQVWAHNCGRFRPIEPMWLYMLHVQYLVLVPVRKHVLLLRDWEAQKQMSALCHHCAMTQSNKILNVPYIKWH